MYSGGGGGNFPEGPDSSEDENGDDGSVWSAIPYGQWGRHAESGGLTKAEQADAVEDVQNQAERYEGIDDR